MYLCPNGSQGQFEAVQLTIFGLTWVVKYGHGDQRMPFGT